MKHHYLSMELIALLCFSVSFPMSGATNQEGMPQIQSAPNPAVPVPTEAHRLALETAGGFARDGFRIRDAEWAFVLAKGMTTFLKVTLFAGNHYRFVVATATPGAKIRLSIYDASGHILKSEQWQDSVDHSGGGSAAGIAPELSGPYFVGVELVDSPSNQPLEFSLVSVYK